VRDAVERLNASMLTLLGLVLVAAGGYGLARSYGAFGADPADEPVLDEPARDLVSHNAGWFWPLAALTSMLLAYLGMRWLLAQLRSGHISRLDLTEDRAPGTTVVRATSAADALARDVGRYPGVRWARARLLRDGARPDVDLEVEVSEDAEVAEVRRRIESHAVPRLRQALEVEDLRARVRFRLSEAASPTR
jgi:hypothetical protein